MRGSSLGTRHFPPSIRSCVLRLSMSAVPPAAARGLFAVLPTDTAAESHSAPATDFHASGSTASVEEGKLPTASASSCHARAQDAEEIRRLEHVYYFSYEERQLLREEGLWGADGLVNSLWRQQEKGTQQQQQRAQNFTDGLVARDGTVVFPSWMNVFKRFVTDKRAEAAAAGVSFPAGAVVGYRASGGTRKGVEQNGVASAATATAATALSSSSTTTPWWREAHRVQRKLQRDGFVCRTALTCAAFIATSRRREGYSAAVETPSIESRQEQCENEEHEGIMIPLDASGAPIAVSRRTSQHSALLPAYTLMQRLTSSCKVSARECGSRTRAGGLTIDLDEKNKVHYSRGRFTTAAFADSATLALLHPVTTRRQTENTVWSRAAGQQVAGDPFSASPTADRQEIQRGEEENEEEEPADTDGVSWAHSHGMQHRERSETALREDPLARAVFGSALVTQMQQGAGSGDVAPEMSRPQERRRLPRRHTVPYGGSQRQARKRGSTSRYTVSAIAMGRKWAQFFVAHDFVTESVGAAVAANDATAAAMIPPMRSGARRSDVASELQQSQRQPQQLQPASNPERRHCGLWLTRVGVGVGGEDCRSEMEVFSLAEVAHAAMAARSHRKHTSEASPAMAPGGCSDGVPGGSDGVSCGVQPNDEGVEGFATPSKGIAEGECAAAERIDSSVALFFDIAYEVERLLIREHAQREALTQNSLRELSSLRTLCHITKDYVVPSAIVLH